MKEGIHPATNDTKVTCACGETFITRAAVQSMQLDICSRCHPFYTGKQKIIDAEGRVEKFRKKYAKHGK